MERKPVEIVGTTAPSTPSVLSHQYLYVLKISDIVFNDEGSVDSGDVRMFGKVTSQTVFDIKTASDGPFNNQTNLKDLSANINTDSVLSGGFAGYDTVRNECLEILEVSLGRRRGREAIR